MTYFIAYSIFCVAIIVVVIFVYQAAILPGIRMTLRYRAFALRDELRSLVIDGVVKESNPAFQLLHQQLNFMCVSMSRFDLARLAQSRKSMDEDGKAQVAAALKTMEDAPVEIKKILEESVKIYMQALTFNSLLFFVAATICLAVGLLLRVGIKRLGGALVNKVHEDSKMGFLSPELSAV